MARKLISNRWGIQDIDNRTRDLFASERSMRVLACGHGNTGQLELMACDMRRGDHGQLPGALREFVIANIRQPNTADGIILLDKMDVLSNMCTPAPPSWTGHPWRS